MNNKKRDNKWHLLFMEETQEKSGRYRYNYVDALAKRREVYSWRLTEANPIPSDKKRDKPLRDREKNIQKKQFHGAVTTDMTVNDLVEPYLMLKMAVDDDLLMKNPFEFQLGTVIVNDSVKREAVTTEQKNDFLNFVKNDNHYCRYCDAFSLLFATGMRISEFCGLTVKNLDFEKGLIVINKQLQRASTMEYVIETQRLQVELENFQ